MRLRRGYGRWVDTWYAYRGVWAAHPWVLGIALLAVAMLAIGVAGTVAGGPFALFFIPRLAGVFGHHLIVGRNTP